MKRITLMWLCAIVFAKPTIAADPIVPEGIQGFRSVVKPFLTKHCAECHRGREGEGGVDITSFPHELKTAAQANKWLKALEQLQAGLMPPLKQKRPNAAERAQVIHWIERTVLASGHAEAYRRKMLMPAYGNHVDHGLLFRGKIKARPYSPARLWRMSPYIFQGIRRVGKVKGLQNPYTFSTPPNGVRDYAATSDVGSSVVETILLNANAELNYQFSQAEAAISKTPKRKKRRKRRRRSNPLAPFLKKDAKVTDEQMKSVIAGTFQRLVSRPPSDAELKKYVTFLKKNIAETSDPKRSVRATLTAIYLSPEAIFRMEWGLGKTDKYGRRMLSPKEIAYSLSYALFDQGPNAGGRAENRKVIAQALNAGKLKTRKDVARVVNEILRSETYKPIGGKARNNVPRVMRFFREFFGYHLAVDVFKDRRRVNEHGLYHDPRRLVQDADNLIKVILREDKRVFERLLTTNEVLVLHDGDNQKLIDQHRQQISQLRAYNEESVRRDIARRKAGILKKPKYKANPKLIPPALKRIEREGKKLLAQKKAELARLLKNGVSLRRIKSRDYRYIRAYNLNTRTWKWPSTQPFRLPENQRAGLLTHPAWLVAHSVNDGNAPVHRGIWVYERLLAGVIGDVPPSVDARVPEDPHKTLRERLGTLRAEACWKCHHKINPLGEAFEAYDDFGRFRTKHYFDQDGKLFTRSAKHVINDEGREVLRSINRDKLVADGKMTTRPVNAKGSFNELGIPELRGEFDNAVEMIHAIAKTKRARQSIIRHMFRYFMGRNEMLSDSQTLIDADRAYANSGGSFKAVLVSLLSSDSFLYRK